MSDSQRRLGDGLDMFPMEGQRFLLSVSGNERGAEKHALGVVFLRVPEPGAGHLAFTMRSAPENQRVSVTLPLCLDFS